MLLFDIVVAVWFAPLAAAGLAAVPVAFSQRYRDHLKRWLVG